MDMEKLESFVLLSNHQNFSKVAEVCFSSQSSVSKHIKSLEKELGVTLFERTSLGTYLTKEGEAFLPYAKNILLNYKKALAALEEIKEKTNTELKVGATSLFGNYVVPPLLCECKKMYPDIKIKVSIDSSKNILEKLYREELDLAFVSDYIPYNEGKYRKQKIMKDSLVLIIPKQHPFSAQASFSIDDLQAETFIIKSVESSLFKFIMRKINEKNPTVKLSNVIEINNQNSIVQTVGLNLGVSIVSSLLLQSEKKQTDVVPMKLDKFDLYREVCCIYPLKPTPLTQKFVDFLEHAYHYTNTINQ